ncbi:MAG: TonB-dependent receptor [Thermoanaerobaculia bacterium]|nr:TonB-dependent receptor [Thermoanaerobaculia bacterium]
MFAWLTVARRLGIALAVLLCFPPILLAEDAPARLTGRVVHHSHEDQPVAGATVTVIELRRTATSDAEGRFAFESLPPGIYTLEAESAEAGNGLVRVRLGAGGDLEVTLPVEVAMLEDELVVTAGSPRSQLDIAQPTNVLTDEELAYRQRPTLGETLEGQAGVSSTYFGPGASRPLIRGLGGDRVRMLSDGLGSADASNTSPDHAVSLDPVGAERIEVLRGPATLLFGSSAVGGVVNVIDERIPDTKADGPIHGSLEATVGSVADERTGSLVLGGGAGRFAWHVDYLKRETDDYEIPGFAEAAQDHEEEEGEEHEGEEEGEGLLENSAQEAESGSVGFSFVGDNGFLGFSASGFDNLYGVPGHAHEEGEAPVEGEEEEEGAVRIDLEQRRFDVKGELRREFGFFQGVRLRLGSNEYEHVELEGDEIGTRFTNDAFEGRFELVQKTTEKLSGTFGLQFQTSDFAAIGEEAFVPASTTDTVAVFGYESIQLREELRLEVGARFESQDLDPESDQPERSFDGLSGSAGLVWDLTDRYTAALSVSHTERLPTATELYANGPHIATRAFEIGDVDLGTEESLGWDLSFRKRVGRVTGSLTLFENRFSDFIFESFTGEEEDGLQVIRFRQADAKFRGAELDAHFDLYHGVDSHVALELVADEVRAELENGGGYLPRIPPRRFGAGVNFHVKRLRGFAEVRHATEQDRVADFETETDSYTLVNAALSYRLELGPTSLDLVLNGRNLTDEEARMHTSYLKDLAPLPGRDVSIGLKLFF